MKRPPDRQPFYIEADGTETPLFVPPAMLDEARRYWHPVWIEPTPMLPASNAETPDAAGAETLR